MGSTVWQFSAVSCGCRGTARHRCDCLESANSATGVRLPVTFCGRYRQIQRLCAVCRRIGVAWVQSVAGSRLSGWSFAPVSCVSL